MKAVDRMNRRTFLKYAAAAAFGAALPMASARVLANPFPGWEPPIYKRFLQFTEYEKRLSTDVIVIHHSGFPDGRDSTSEAIHRFHQETNGWAGIGYHYFIRKDGMIEQGRRPDMVGAHVYGHNKNSVGICLSGNFDFQTPTEAQMDSVKLLTAWLCGKYGLDPMKKGVIVGHRDLNEDTGCPGNHLYARLEEIRRYRLS